MNIGYACTPIMLKYTTNRRFIIKNFQYERFYNCVKANLEDLYNILKENKNNDIYFFRISSDIIPFGGHEINDIKWWEIFKEDLQHIGQFIKENNIRVSMHPGQYTILNSPSQEVVNKSIKEIEYHIKFLDSLGLNYTHKIVMHLGGAYGNKSEAIDRFKSNFKKLTLSTKKRLVLENDDRIYTIDDVLKLCSDIGVPAVFDNLHHKCNPSLNNNLDEILKEVMFTWKKEDGIPKMHYSDEDSIKKKGAHSSFVDTEKFLHYYNKVKSYNVDIMLEVKDKDISAMKCIKILQSINVNSSMQNKIIVKEQCEKYKYLIRERGYNLYTEFIEKFTDSEDVIKFYKYIDKALKLKIQENDFKNTLGELLKEFKSKITETDKNAILKFINNSPMDYKKIKEKLKRLAIKYNIEDLIKSYYFYY